MRYAVITDFDGTVTMRDMAHVLVEHYKVNDVIREPEHATDEDAKTWMRNHIGAIKAGKEEFENFIKTNAVPREGFARFVSFCQAGNIPLEITSGGVDVYINPVLEKMAVSGVTLYSASGKFIEGGIEIDFPLLKDYSLDDFKASRVRFYKEKGYKTIYCGDGRSDYKAAVTADIAFARENLAALMDQQGKPYKPLTTYTEIQKILEENYVPGNI